MEQKLSAINHPSLFQTPSVDAKLDAQPILVSATDPQLLWGIAAQSAGKKPPLTPTERKNIVKKMVPATRIRTGNGYGGILLSSFMSRQNTNNLHHIIRHLVKQFSGHAIGQQSDMELTGIMLAVYKAHAVDVNEDVTPRDDLVRHVRNEILRLNTLVSQAVVPGVVNAVEQHLGFLAAVEKPRSDASLALPVNTNTKGTK